MFSILIAGLLTFFPLSDMVEDFPADSVNRQWSSPLDLPISLSANFGELRGGHLHAGIDLRFFGNYGTKIYSIEKGYVSRVSVSPTGYGNAVYISHPDGYTSVYAHLDSFNPALAKRVREEQYKRESFAVVIDFEPYEFPVEQREFIGRGGNSGSSAGPHLHLEVRDRENNPINIINRGFHNTKIKDDKPPVFQNVAFVAIDNSSGVWRSETVASFQNPYRGVIKVPKQFYVAVDACDKQNDTPAKLAVDEYKILLDGNEIFFYKNRNYTRQQSSSMVSLLDFHEYSRNNRSMLKSFAEPLYLYSDRTNIENGGVIDLEDTDEHIVTIILEDEHGNVAQRSFRVQWSGDTQPHPERDSSLLYVPWYAPTIYRESGFELIYPAAALYRSIYLSINRHEEIEIFYQNFPLFSEIWSIEPTTPVPYRSPAKISLKADVPEELRDKALIVRCSDNGRLSSQGGIWKTEGIEARISGFGTYFVSIDTIPPRVKPQFDINRVKQNRDRLDFTISDELSGIHSYRAEIEGEWILLNYDEKIRRLSLSLRGQIKSSSKARELRLEVVDRKGNITVFNYMFIW